MFGQKLKQVWASGFWLGVSNHILAAFMNVPEYINQRALSSGGMEYITHIEYDASSPARYICSTTNREPGIWTTLSASLPSELVDVVVGNMDRRIEWCRLGFEAEWVCMVDKHLFKDTLVIPLQDALKNGQNVRVSVGCSHSKYNN